MINTEKLRGRIIENNTTIYKLAPKVGYSAYTLGKMISNKSKMTIDVSEKLINELDIKEDEIVQFFYK